jgi:hypothetical protein
MMSSGKLSLTTKMKGTHYATMLQRPYQIGGQILLVAVTAKGSTSAIDYWHFDRMDELTNLEGKGVYTRKVVEWNEEKTWEEVLQLVRDETKRQWKKFLKSPEGQAMSGDPPQPMVCEESSTNFFGFINTCVSHGLLSHPTTIEAVDGVKHRLQERATQIMSEVKSQEAATAARNLVQAEQEGADGSEAVPGSGVTLPVPVPDPAASHLVGMDIADIREMISQENEVVRSNAAVIQIVGRCSELAERNRVMEAREVQYEAVTANLQSQIREFQTLSASSVVAGLLPALRGELIPKLKYDEKKVADMVVDRLYQEGGLATTLSDKLDRISGVLSTIVGEVVKVESGLESVGLARRSADAPRLDLPGMVKAMSVAGSVRPMQVPAPGSSGPQSNATMASPGLAANRFVGTPLRHSGGSGLLPALPPLTPLRPVAALFSQPPPPPIYRAPSVSPQSPVVMPPGLVQSNLLTPPPASSDFQDFVARRRQADQDIENQRMYGAFMEEQNNKRFRPN